MFEQVLKEIGLSPNEAKIYETLLSLDSANVSVISVKANVHRRNVYDSISRLIEKGLLSEMVVDGEKRFKAIDPKVLMSLIKDKESILEKQLPDMSARFKKIESKEQAMVYRGVKGFRNYMQDILDTGEDVYSIGAKGGWWDERLEPFRERFYKELRKKKLNVFTLFDEEMKTKMPEVVKVHEGKSKFIPKKYITNSAIDVFGDHVVTFTGLETGRLSDNITQFVIISKELADSYRTWIKMMWDFLPGKKFGDVNRLT